MQIELPACHTYIAQCHECINVHHLSSRRIEFAQGTAFICHKITGRTPGAHAQAQVSLVHLLDVLHFRSFQCAIILSKLNRSCTGGDAHKLLLLHGPKHTHFVFRFPEKSPRGKEYKVGSKATIYRRKRWTSVKLPGNRVQTGFFVIGEEKVATVSRLFFFSFVATFDNFCPSVRPSQPETT
jgi:hypothetical protein